MTLSQTNWTEKQTEEANSIYVDKIYQQIFGEDILIKRSTYDNTDKEISLLDQKYAIDSQIRLTSGCKITAQEKLLQFSKSHFNQLTIEYRNNRPDSNNGDWFSCFAHYYFFGYTNETADGLLKWWIFDVPKLMIYLTYEIGIDTLKEKYLRQNPAPARASFFAIPIELLENKNLILFQG